MPVKSREESIPSLKPTPPAFGLRGGLAQPFDGEENVPSVMPCCGQSHPWDQFAVETEWAPDRLRCLVVGENPGSTSTAYFYEADRGVAVRTILLGGLYRAGIVSEPTLAAFRAAGFLFDHGIRCRLPGDTVTTQRRLARSYSSPWANGCTHLTPLIRGASAVWVMGYVARNAVAAAWSDFPRETGDIARCPYPRQIAEAPNFFVSRYLTRAPHDQVGAVFREFVPFWLSRGADVSGPSNSAVQRTEGSRCSPSGR